MLSKSKRNTHIKFLMGKKLSKAISIEAHSASESVVKEFKRMGAEIKLIKYSKKNLKVNKDKSPTIKTSEDSKVLKNETSIPKTKNNSKKSSSVKTASKEKKVIKLKLKLKPRLNNGFCF